MLYKCYKVRTEPDWSRLWHHNSFLCILLLQSFSYILQQRSATTVKLNKSQRITITHYTKLHFTIQTQFWLWGWSQGWDPFKYQHNTSSQGRYWTLIILKYLASNWALAWKRETVELFLCPYICFLPRFWFLVFIYHGSDTVGGSSFTFVTVLAVIFHSSTGKCDLYRAIKTFQEVFQAEQQHSEWVSL